MFISGCSIDNLSGLDSLISVVGTLGIEQNNNLQNLSELENFTYTGGLYIQDNNNLLNLTGLENLTSIDGGLTVRNNNNLQNLTGLENVTSIASSVIVHDNNDLLNFTGLENLTSINSSLSIWENSSLESFTGLENLTSIEAFLSVLDNDELRDITALRNLTSIDGALVIGEHLHLQSLAGLENLDPFALDNLSIYDNISLSDCSILSICTYLAGGTGLINISNNNSISCSDANDILSYCENIGKSYFSFLITIFNSNAIQDTDEPLLSGPSLLIEPGNCVTYGNSTYGGVKYLNYGSYSGSLNEMQLPDWELTSGTSSYNINLSAFAPTEILSFGMIPSSFLTNISNACINGLPRCNELVDFEVLTINKGTTIADGTLCLI